MKEQNQNTIGELIKSFIIRNKGVDFLDENIIIQKWKDVVGPFIAQYTTSLYINNGVLYVRMSSDALRHELNYSKTLLLKNLNEVVGRELLTDIVIQ